MMCWRNMELNEKEIKVIGSINRKKKVMQCLKLKGIWKIEN